MARSRKGKKGKRRVFLLVEGKTEQKYFESLCQKLRLSNVRIRAVVLKNSGENWIDKAKNLLKNDHKLGYDKKAEVFIIFDKDEYESEKLNKMFKDAQKENFQIGFSNVAFEVWLLAHFEQLTPRLLTTSKLKEKLGKHLSHNYKKTDSSQLEKIVENYETAITNADRVSMIDFKYQCTNIGSVIRKIKS